MSNKLNSQYKQLCRTILERGSDQKGRNGLTTVIPTYSFTIENMEDDHQLTLRKLYFKGVEGEFKTLIDSTPLTNVKQFEANGCNYWKTWAEANTGNINIDYHNRLHPQLEDVIVQMIEDPSSRRHVISLWSHENVMSGELSLPNCWHNLTFSVIDGVIHLNWVQRSVDVAVGLPSDIYLAYLFMKHISDLTGYTIGSCMFSLSNVHLYSEHIEGVKELLKRDSTYSDTPLKFELKG